MKQWHFKGAVVLIGSLVLGLTIHAAESAGSTNGFVSMFNGKDLTGWEGSPGWWTVREGVLMSESTPEKPCNQSHYLYWKGGEPADFEMRCQWRITGPANSGIQFRSEKRPNWDAWGYQADFDAAGEYVGCLYQHVRGLVAQRGEKVRIDAAGKKTITTFADSQELLKAIKPGDWNEYRILAEGPKITMWINNVLMCEVEDYEPKFALPKGIIALQMHQGPPMKVEFKDLQIRIKR
ncbi:MAG: DUF1080 domain-containing protein [Verrucomicrobia bacterium]|nr:DUF1080 domain-containing protein [Verrucomicrobiota bacterium]